MAFEGDLRNLPLADVLQTIHQNNLTGTLTVKDSRGERRVAFAQGFITAFQPAPGDVRPVLDALTKRRLVTRSDAEKARSGFLGKRKTLRMALASRGLVTEEDYQKAVKEDVLEGIYELFLENDRTFKFEDGQTDLATWDQDQLAAEIRLAAPPIVMEGARRCDEWGRIRRSVGTFQDVLVRDGGGEDGDDDIVREILQLADGTRDLSAILDALPVARFKGCESVAALIANRRLRPATVQEYLGLGQKAEERGAFDEAASHYDRGLALERGNLQLRERRATALERAGRRNDAADERKLLATTLIEQGKRQEAAAELSKAADLNPRDPLPLERRLQLAQEDQDRDVARVTVARLAALYEDLGLAEKSREVLRARVSRDPEDDELREKLAELLQRQGDAKGSAREWSELAGRAMRTEQLALAAARYRKALEVDPGDEQARALLKDLETGELVQRRIRRQKRVRLALLSAFVTLLALWIGREASALFLYQKVHVETGYTAVAEGTPEGVKQTLEKLVSVRCSYRWSLASRQADELAVALVDVFAKTIVWTRDYDTLLKPPPGNVPRKMGQEFVDRLKPLTTDAEKLVTEGDGLLHEGQREKAAISFDKAIVLVRQGGTYAAQASDAVRNTDEVKKLADRIDRAHLRARVGLVRSLDLPEEARRKLEDHPVIKTLPAVGPNPADKPPPK